MLDSTGAEVNKKRCIHGRTERQACAKCARCVVCQRKFKPIDYVVDHMDDVAHLECSPSPTPHDFITSHMLMNGMVPTRQPIKKVKA